MYEPKYIPNLDQSLAGLRFGIAYNDKPRKNEDPEADPLHVHNYLGLFFNLSSDVSFLVNSRLYPVAIGDAVISLPEDIHMGIFHSAAAQEYLCIWIDADLTLPLFSFLQKEDFCPLCSFDAKAKKELRVLLLLLRDAFLKNGSELEKASYLFRILTFFEKERSNSVADPLAPDSLQKILDDIHQNFSTIHNVGDILKTHSVSSATLTRWFRQYLHTTPREYLESVRLSNALTLLLGGANVTDACLNSGFPDCSHFIVLFKRKFGDTPLQYQKKNAKKRI